MSDDPFGYVRLHRSLQFVSQELGAADDAGAKARIEQAALFFGGSPSEFLGESAIALKAVLDSPRLAPSLAAFVRALLNEIEEGATR